MKQNNNRIFVGLTGGIGSGKTTVADVFRTLGAEVLDADEISRFALSMNGPCVKKTVDAFGNGILNEDGSVNRRALSDIVFNDEDKRKLLNSIIHPYVIHELLRRASKSEKSIIVFDVPLLFECGMDRMMNKIVAVDAPREQRIFRVMKRNNCSREEVERRIGAQSVQEKRFRDADFTINNCGTMEDLHAEAERVYNIIREQLL